MPSCFLLAVAALLLAFAPGLSALTTKGWVLGPVGVTCNEACPLTPDNWSSCYVDSMKALATPMLVDNAFREAGLGTFDCSKVLSSGSSYGPALDFGESLSPSCHTGSTSTDCESFHRTARRLCCCGGPCSASYSLKWASVGVNVGAPLAHWACDGFVYLDVLYSESHP